MASSGRGGIQAALQELQDDAFLLGQFSIAPAAPLAAAGGGDQ
jgi:hypothetical protein